RAGRHHDGDGSATEFAVEAGEFAQLRRGMAVKLACSWLDKNIERARGLSKHGRMADPVVGLWDRGWGDHGVGPTATRERKQQQQRKKISRQSNGWQSQFSGGVRGVDHD